MAERGVIFKDDFVSTPNRSWFDMSYDYLFTMNFGELIPSTMMECLAKDVVHAKSDSFVRLAPLVAPTFGKCNMFSYHFYVRNRSIWKQWEEFFADNDQRESWQQANPNWTPPEMPWISPLKMIDFFADGYLGNNENRRDGQILSSAHFYSDQGFLMGSKVNNLQVLKITASVGATLSAGVNMNRDEIFNIDYASSTGDFDTDAESILIAFLPNKYEPEIKLPDDSELVENVPHNFYNPFSNGTLFDYLGVDLSGHYHSQWSRFTTFLGQVRTALNDVDFELNVHTDGRIDEGGVDYINLKDFLDNHHVVMYGYNHNRQLVSLSCHSSTLTLIGDQEHEADIAALDIPCYDYESRISTLPLRAYHQVYIDYFRDQNYISINPQIDWTRDGEDYDWDNRGTGCVNIFNYLTLYRKAYEHDPYTTALPQAQRGNSVRFLPDANIVETQTRTQPSGTSFKNLRIDNNGSYSVTGGITTSSNSVTNIAVDLSAATIENFRFANALQRLSEKIARSGGRYYEYMRAVYGADIEDAKIDRAIYLGGDKSPIQISEVLQTSASQITDDQPLGQMAGRGISLGNDDRIEYITPDNGFFVEICCALPRTNYQQGLSPMFSRMVRLDFATPDFAQLGEEQVPRKELYYSANETDDERPFGFQSRYYTMKYQRDRTSGSFKDNLAFWTWTRIFDEAPIAGQEFLEVRPDYRQFAVTDKNTEHIYCHMFHDIQVNRCLPVMGVPSL